MSERILRNQALIKRLQTIAASGRVANAYILSGPDGSGKNLIADAFQELLHVSAADRINVVHEKPGLVSVEDIRSGINLTAAVLPYESRYKLYVVDEAEKMNVQAQNALLKTLEEPPAYVVILLLTESAETFLPTILSRAVQFRTDYVPEDEIERFLLEKGIAADVAGIAARLSGGAPGKALKIADSDAYRSLVREVTELAGAADGPDPEQALSFAKKMAERKGDADEVITLFRTWYRDALVLKTGDGAPIFFRGEEERLRKIAKKLSFEGIGRIVAAIVKLNDRLKANVNTELSFESFAGAIRDEIQKEI